MYVCMYVCVCVYKPKVLDLNLTVGYSATVIHFAYDK